MPETTTLSARVGIDPVARVFVMENHDRAYKLWHDEGMRDRILVHVDAHHDMWWLDDVGSLSIANFVCQALKENITREVYWVIPEATWQNSAGRAAVRQHLRKIGSRYPGGASSQTWTRNSVRTRISGADLIVCSLDALPVLSEPVLLDIDVDYLAILSVSFGKEDSYGPVPWQWPDQLIEGLKQKKITTDFATICYSIEGGYTPLHLKYLGDELQARLEQPSNVRAVEPYEQMKRGIIARSRGEYDRAERDFRAVVGSLGPAPLLSLAYTLAENGKIDDARASYRKALELDPGYRAPYSSSGIQLYLARSYTDAEHAFQVSASLDDADPYAKIGLAWVALERSEWRKAESQARNALAIDPNLIDARRALAKALRKQGRFAEAIQEYEESLKLGLSGHKGFTGVIATGAEPTRLTDGEHVRVHERLATLYEKTGQSKRALAGYRIAIASGRDYPLNRFRVARLYVRQRHWKDAASHVYLGLRQVPAATRRLGSLLTHKLL